MEGKIENNDNLMDLLGRYKRNSVTIFQRNGIKFAIRVAERFFYYSHEYIRISFRSKTDLFSVYRFSH